MLMKEELLKERRRRGASAMLGLFSKDVASMLWVTVHWAYHVCLITGESQSLRGWSQLKLSNWKVQWAATFLFFKHFTVEQVIKPPCKGTRKVNQKCAVC